MTEVFDSSDQKAVAKRIAGAKDKDAILKEALVGIMQTPSGRSWLKSVLDRCSPYRSPFSSDPIQMAFSCGEQNIGLQLVAELHAASTDLYLTMMKENPN
jgi:hypothetical protein